MADEAPASLPVVLMVQSILAILLGVFGLIGVIFGLLGLIGSGAGSAMMLFAGLDSGDTYALAFGGWSALGLVVAAVALLFGLVESLLAAAGGAMALATRRVSALGWAGLLCALHLILIDLVWGLTNQVVTIGITVGLGPDLGAGVAGSVIGALGSIPVYVFVLIKAGFWLWTWRSARSFMNVAN